jgi:hypothetical protein
VRTPLRTGPPAADLTAPHRQGRHRQPHHHGYLARANHVAERVVSEGGRRLGRPTGHGPGRRTHQAEGRGLR